MRHTTMPYLDRLTDFWISFFLEYCSRYVCAPHASRHNFFLSIGSHVNHLTSFPTFYKYSIIHRAAAIPSCVKDFYSYFHSWRTVSWKPRANVCTVLPMSANQIISSRSIDDFAIHFAFNMIGLAIGELCIFHRYFCRHREDDGGNSWMHITKIDANLGLFFLASSTFSIFYWNFSYYCERANERNTFVCHGKRFNCRDLLRVRNFIEYSTLLRLPPEPVSRCDRLRCRIMRHNRNLC